MRDLVPELSSGSSEDEASMMKHLEGSQQPQPCENYMTHNCVTIIPVEYPRSDSSSLSEQEICVYLLTKVCLCVEVNSLPMATSDEIVEIIAQDDAEMNLPSQATEFFALWMTSPLLELQLKPDHRPYLIRERWSEYLKKYTFASKRQLETDEPVLTFQRNVFLDKEKEK
ncbi:conserved hypothetical protein, partial [Ixodes scapularis]